MNSQVTNQRAREKRWRSIEDIVGWEIRMMRLKANDLSKEMEGKGGDEGDSKLRE